MFEIARGNEMVTGFEMHIIVNRVELAKWISKFMIYALVMWKKFIKMKCVEEIPTH